MNLKLARWGNAITRHWLSVSVGLAVLSAVLLPLNLLTLQRLHHDEALYATWALKIVSGNDPWLASTPIDKPPLFLYTAAGVMHLLGVTETVARLPSLIATAFIVLLTFWLGRKLYGNAAGALAAWLVALSPFMLLFAPTTFTDPMLVALVLAGCLAAAHHRAGWAGVCLGLTIATKQQGALFAPLIGMLLVTCCRLQGAGSRVTGSTVARVRKQKIHSALRTPHSALCTPHLSRLTPHALRFTAALLLTLLPVLIWDLFRRQPSALIEQSVSNYGGLSANLAGFDERWQGFVDLLWYGTGSSLLNTIFLIGSPLLLIYGLLQMAAGHLQKSQKLNSSAAPHLNSSALTDWILALFSLAFLLLHALFSFQVWDRYLLGLMPLLALLLARVLLLPWAVLKKIWLDTSPHTLSPIRFIFGLGLVVVLALTLATPVQDAINARYPLGSNSRALRGIEQITAYLQGHVGANNTLYHHWLGTHWRFYLWNYPYDLQYWDSPLELVAKAQPGHLIALPAWRSDTEIRIALYKTGLTLRQLTRAYAPNGAPSITLYKIEAAP